jgi:hypothetical protein
MFFWVLAIIVRKFFIAFTSLMFRRSAAFQLAGSLLVMFLAYAAQVKWQPYMSPQDFDLVLKSHLESSFTSAIHARLRASLAGIENRGKKRVHKNVMTKDGRIDTAALLGVLSSWFFNYNTVEAVLLFSAIIVCLMGIMYQAGTVASTAYTDARDGITGVIMAAIIITIVYFVTVVVTEIMILAAEEQRKKELAKGKSGSFRKSLADKEGKEGGSGDKGKDGSSGPRASSVNDPDFNVGAVENSTNPMFLQKNGQGSVSLGSAADAIKYQREPPTADLWQVFREHFSDLQSQVEKLSEQLIESKMEVQRLGSVVTEVGDLKYQVDSARSQRKLKSEFQPQATVTDPAAPGQTTRNPMASARSAAGMGLSSSPGSNASNASLRGQQQMVSLATLRSVDKRAVMGGNKRAGGATTPRS